ncbi:hypothetical protein [Erysipelothrix tonsillarum]|uniref:hypothetical protein n=1 Tax=Erysipelothrix tonsillarum TaxID=38402 RepID=UPI0039C85107
MFVYIPPPPKPQAPLPVPTGNAVPIDVRSGKSFSSSDGTEIFGTLPERSSGPLTLVPDRTTQTKTSGIYNGDITVQPIPSHLIDTRDATIDPTLVLQGNTGYAKGVKVTGNMPLRNQEHIPSTEVTTWAGDRVFLKPPYGYYPGTNWVTAAAPGLLAGNIKHGVNILGIVGTLNPSIMNSLVYPNGSGTIVGPYASMGLEMATVVKGTSLVRMGSRSTTTSQLLYRGNGQTNAWLTPVLRDSNGLIWELGLSEPSSALTIRDITIDLVYKIAWSNSSGEISTFVAPSNFNFGADMKFGLYIRGSASMTNGYYSVSNWTITTA